MYLRALVVSPLTIFVNILIVSCLLPRVDDVVLLCPRPLSIGKVAATIRCHRHEAD